MAHDLETRQRFLELRSQGCSYDKIAQELHIAKRTAIAWGLELKSQLDTLRAVHFNSLLEEVSAQKEKRIELLSSHLQRLMNELARRRISSIHETNLFNLILRFTVAIRKEDESFAPAITFKPDDPLLNPPADPSGTKTAPELHQISPSSQQMPVPTESEVQNLPVSESINPNSCLPDSLAPSTRLIIEKLFLPEE